MVVIDVIGILTVQVLQAIGRSIIYVFNILNKQADGENNNNLIGITIIWVFTFLINSIFK